VGGNVQAAKLIRQPLPLYPEKAKSAGVEGTVVLHAIIAKDGSVQEVQYVSGPALLMRAAMDAVKQWKYQPTLLQGRPVEVDSTISVVFSLGGSGTSLEDLYVVPPVVREDAKSERPFDELELLAFCKSNMYSPYAFVEMKARGLEFKPDAEFIRMVISVGLRDRTIELLRDYSPITATSMSPERGAAFSELKLAIEASDRSSADSHYQRALQLAPDSATLHSAFGGNLLVTQQFDGAEKEFRRALQQWPNDADAHTLLAAVLMSTNRSAEAVPEAREALRIFPRDKAALTALGFALTQSDQYADAIPVLREAIQRTPEMPLLKKHLGVCLLHTGDLDGAIDQLTSYLSGAPSDAEGHYELGAALRAKGKKDDAIVQFQEAHRLDPANPVFASVSSPDDEAKPADQSGGPKPDDSFFSDNVYTSTFFGFSYEYPKNWVVLGRDAGTAIARFGGNFLAGTDPTIPDVVEAAVRHSYSLLVVMGGAAKAGMGNGRLVQIHAINLDVQPGVKTGEDFVKALVERYPQGSAVLQFAGQPEEVKVDGRSFWKVNATVHVNGAVAYSAELATLEKDYLLLFVFSSSDAAGLEEGLKSFESLHFADGQK
jgi:TonB family protein